MPASDRTRESIAKHQVTKEVPHTGRAEGGSHVHHARLPALVLADLLGHHVLPAILVGLGDLLLEVDDSLGWVQTLGAAIGAVHDAVAAVELHGVVDPRKALLSELVPGVRD